MSVPGRASAPAALAALALLAVVLVTGCAATGSVDGDAARPSPPAGSSATPDDPVPPSTAVPEPADPPGPPTVLFFGDSYVVGGGYTDAEGSMAALAAAELGWEHRVAGGGGTGFATGNPEFGLPPFPEQIAAGALDGGPVDWLVVEGGGNDDGVAPDVVTRAAVETLRAAARRHPEARVVLVAGMDPTVEDFRDTAGVTGALARAADVAGVPFVDGQRWLAGRPDLVGPDFDHPVPAGHELCGRRLAAALRDLA